MNSLLDALQAGRLIEMPDNNKEHALQILANLIEAIPEVAAGTDVAGGVLVRERSANTGLGMGWACPHARIPGEGELLCAIGWSPAGIDYGATDSRAVRIVIMYLVPENQKNAYLKEISSLAKALHANAGFQNFESATTLNEVRDRLLDLVNTALESAVPDARARMIRLEARHAAAMPVSGLSNWTILPLMVVAGGAGSKPLVLTQHRDLIEVLERQNDLVEQLARHGIAEVGGWRILVRGTTPYPSDRIVYDCLALRAVTTPSVKPAD